MKIGEFIYPWGNGHYSRMMRLNKVLPDFIDEFQLDISSKGSIYQKLVEKFPNHNIHEILMPTPIDGKMGPSILLSMLNILLPVANNRPLVTQIINYLRKERQLYDSIGFDLVINDGDMGSNVLAYNRDIPSLFITNQFMPKLWRSRSYFYPALKFISKQIAKASKILVADSPPPYTMCQYNLNFPDKIKPKVEYVGHFTAQKIQKGPQTDLEKLIIDREFGYWMRTGNKSTNDGTGEKYNKVFCDDQMINECRIISHARDDPAIDSVMDKKGKRYSISQALEKKIDWIQIDVGFLSDQQKDTVLDLCKYAVVNGSHTVMGEILGDKARPIIGMPIYDEHTNQLLWAQRKMLGVLARDTKQVINAIENIKENYNKFQENLADFSENFDGNGAKNTAKIALEILENKQR